MGTPGKIARSLRWAVCVSVAAIVVLGLPPAGAEEGPLEALRKELAKAVRLNDVPGTAAVVREIAALGSREAMGTLLQAAISIPEEQVYEAAIESFEKVEGEEAIAFLSEVLRRAKKVKRKFGRWPMRVAVAEAFGARKDDATYEPLEAALHDPAFPVKRQVMKSLARRGDRRAVPVLIEFLAGKEEAPGVLWEDALDSLRAITGQNLAQAADWKNWWDAHGQDAPAPKPAEGKAPKEKEQTTKVDIPAHFFGVEIVSKRIVFLIDCSGSMQWWDPGGKGEKGKTPKGEKESRKSRVRIYRAKNELIRVIKDLRKEVKFNIITFSSRLTTLNPGKLISANKKNKTAAIRFTQRLRANGATISDDALREGFGMEEANTIILLSDGVVMKPGGNEPTSDEMLAMVRRLNRFRKVKIHTFGFEGEGRKPDGVGNPGRMTPALQKEFREMMMKLAEENDGTWTSIR